MKQRRPEKWEETTFHLGLDTPYKCASKELRVFGDGVEAGADAMLGELKKEAIHIKTTKGWEYLKCSYEAWLHGNKVGYIIFIEEEK